MPRKGRELASEGKTVAVGESNVNERRRGLKARDGQKCRRDAVRLADDRQAHLGEHTCSERAEHGIVVDKED